MKQKTGLNKAHKTWFTSLVDWDRRIRNWLCTEEHKTNIVQDMWENELAILEYHLPFCSQDLLAMTVEFLQKSHELKLDFSPRDGINLLRLMVK